MEKPDQVRSGLPGFTIDAIFADLTRLCRFISTIDAIFADLTRL
jgi:hypothetical protein